MKWIDEIHFSVLAVKMPPWKYCAGGVTTMKDQKNADSMATFDVFYPFFAILSALFQNKSLFL